LDRTSFTFISARRAMISSRMSQGVR
jgi:hypothetical protein